MARTSGASPSAAAREDRTRVERLPLEKAALILLEECRMVLPGIQALFGFQLIAVLSPLFSQALSVGQQRLHLVAVGLVALAIALIMTPAAYHRQTGAGEVSEAFLSLASRLLLWSMGPLAVAMCLDSYLVGFVILRSHWAALFAAALLLVFTGLWWVLPRSKRLGAILGRAR